MFQMQVIQKRWVQVALAVMRMCAFVVNGLWSHTDAESIGHMVSAAPALCRTDSRPRAGGRRCAPA